jgi:hypothetical protein
MAGIETVTVTACGYGSPVVGNNPTMMQLAHYWLCEAESAIVNVSDYVASELRDLLDNLWGDFKAVGSWIAQKTGSVFSGVTGWLHKAASQLASDAQALWQRIQSEWAKDKWIVIAGGALLFGLIFFGPEIAGGLASGAASAAAKRKRRRE